MSYSKVNIRDSSKTKVVSFTNAEKNTNFNSLCVVPIHGNDFVFVRVKILDGNRWSTEI